MTQKNKISQYILRTALILVLMLGAALNVAAQTDYSQTSVWDGTAATPTGGTTLRTKSLIDPSITATAGTEDNPYLIESAADLKYLQATNTLWTKSFEQMVDIDLGGKVLGMIGSSNNGNTPFSGKYDARGHKIRNLRVEWKNATNIGLGLFGYVTGEVRNLVVDNALVTFTKDLTAGADFKVGVLAGAIAPPAKLENISIIKSQITDAGYTGDIKASFVGGLVGDIASSFGDTQQMDLFGEVKINNIYSEVDIDLTNYVPNGTNAFQFNIGGIFGRMRRGLAEDLPTNTIYTGKIKAPKGMVGPIFGASRADGEGNEKGMAYHYAGQLTPPNQTADKNEPKTYHLIDDNSSFDDTNLYYDYQVWDDREGEEKYVAINDATSLVSTTLTHKEPNNATGTTTNATIRTFTAPKLNSGANNASTITWSSFQGVNQGGCIADAAAAASKLAALNSTSDYNWSLNTSTKEATFEDKAPAVLSLTAQQTAWNTFEATLTGATAGETYKYAWYTVLNNGTANHIATTSTATLTSSAVCSTANLKEVIVILCNDDGTPYLDDNDNTVFRFFTLKYTAVVDYTIVGDNGGPFTILTPKVYQRTLATNADEAISSDGWTFKVEVYNSSKVLYKEITSAEETYYNGTTFRLPPNTNGNSHIALVGTSGNTDFSSALKKIPADLYVQLSTSTFTREFLPEGQKFYLTLKMATGDKDTSGKELKFANDWGMTYTWIIKKSDDVLDQSDAWNQFTHGVTDDGKLWVMKDDHSLSARYFYVNLRDYYGFDSPRNFSGSGEQIASTNNKSLIKNNAEFQTYNFVYKWVNGTVLKPGTSRFIDYKYYANDDVDNYQPLADISTLANDTFTIKRIHMANTIYQVRMYDKYDYVFSGDKGDGKLGWPFSSTITVNAPTDVNLVGEGGQFVPEFVFGNKTYRFDKSEWGLTYSWQVKYYSADNDDDNSLIDEATEDGYGNVDAINLLFKTAKKAKVLLTATDYLGISHTFSKNISLENISAEVIQAGTAPNYTFTARLVTRDGQPLADTGGTWKWYGVNGDIMSDTSNRFELTGATSSTLTLNSTNNNYSSYVAVWTFGTGSDAVKAEGFWAKKDIVYVYDKSMSDAYSTKKGNAQYTALADYPDGNDYNDGRTPQTAVKTMRRAYELLDADKSAIQNMIVVMGYLHDEQFMTMFNPDDGGNSHYKQMMPKEDYKRNTTITGSYGEITTMGTLVLTADVLGINGATIFKDIILSGLPYNKADKTFGSAGLLHFYCNLNDLTIGNNVKVQDYTNMASNNGLLSTNAPHITIVGGFHQYDNSPFEYPSGNAVPGQTTLIFLSGNWGRVIASGRSNGLNTVSNNVFGHPEAPHRVAVNVAIKHSKKADGTDNKSDYTPGKTYDYDIGLLVGGQTDGSVYVDAKLYMSSGTVGRFVSGNISYGRETGAGFPTDGFYGSTELTLEGGEIKELVGGTLGRHNSNAEKCEAYFYGRSILNINGGTVGSIDNNDNLTGNIYGAGAGGVVGIGDNDDEGFHTKDKNIPYYTGNTDAEGRKEVKYGNYKAAKGNMPVMTLLDGTQLNLADSYCIVNVNGGTINGNVYGGGYGYSKDIPAIRALDQAGDLFGRSYVNVRGGVIKGNVYGGGAGSDEFYNKFSKNVYDDYLSKIEQAAKDKAKKEGKTEAEQNAAGAAAKADPANIAEAERLKGLAEQTGDGTRDQFLQLANIFGDTHVSISGGIIEGKVFAGSKGIAGFPNMATLYGNTNLTIENFNESDNTTRVPIINNNIYGGSELGAITDSTHVTINGGAIGNCIFGGSEGIATVRDAQNNVTTAGTTAYLGGNTNLIITGGTYFTAEHAAKISTANQIAAADRTFNIYGGGYNNCIIEGNTNVTIKKSLLTSYLCLIEPDPKDATKKRSFENCVNDRTYRKFSVYGAGRGELTDVKKNANLKINIEGGASVPSSRPVDVANNQQFFMIAGGGMAGHVWGDTNVELNGNVFARRIYGGGMYGNVLGDANMTVRRGAYYGVFGGGLLGNVKGNANLRIGTKAGRDEIDPSITVSFEDAADANRNLYIYDNVYGGNDVSGCTGYETTDSLWNDGNYDTFIKGADKLTMTDAQKSHHYLFEHWGTEADPYYRHLIRASEEKGVNLKIYGGKILGDVFGAGNGNHTGYYVPNNAISEHHNAGAITRMMFYEGLPYHYRVNKKDANSYEEADRVYNEATNTYTGTLKSVLDPQIRQDYGLYEYRPRVGKVVMHIGGNSETDRVEIGGDVYGGGHACTIGLYDPARDVLTDPLRFKGGGSLKMNFGSHVTVKNSVYMGSRGRIIGQQTVKEPDNVYETTTLNSDYDYHYFDPEYDNGDGTTGRYLLGFPNSLEGRMRFHAYMQLVNMNATTELSFFDQTDNKESKDVRWGSFFAGGARGSMTKLILPENDPKYVAKKTDPYEYTLPVGLTVESRVVGGSEDAEITYYDYKTKTGDNAFTEIDETKPLFTFLGGIVYDEHTDGHFGGGQVLWHEAPDDDDALVGDESPRGSLVVMKLNVNCQFDPQKAIAVNNDFSSKYDMESGEVSDDGEQYWGGLVYGGCYNSGITNGSVEVTCSNTLLGQVDAEFKNFKDYLTASSLRRNVARVYGGGFGKSSTILGNTKVTLKGKFRGFNVFGGGMTGDVTGGTEVYVQDSALVYNAVYGGGMLGKVGLPANEYAKKDSDEDYPYHDILSAPGTHINLISGGVDRVYGGAFSGDVYGGTHITASDEQAVIAAEAKEGEKPKRLMVGSIYGGNDVTGKIYKDAVTGLSTYISVSEKPSTKKTKANRFFLTSESKTENDKYYAGYPMIGTIYGAGNGNMVDYVKGVTIDRENNCYNGGRIHIANGNGADYNVYDLGVDRKALPDVETTKIDITGGTIINVYGGGSMCTATESDYVSLNYTDTVARAAFLTSKNDEMTWGILRLFEDLQKSEVTTEIGDTIRFSYQIYRVFGGNNLMDMDIQPTWNLQRGHVFSVYSGGNFGKMTYCKDNFTGIDNSKPRGLELTIDSPDIRIETVYGGGRVGDIEAKKRVETTDANGVKSITYEELDTPFSPTEYGATLNIKKGIIGDVYGGNNVAGNVFNGTNVNITGAISGNVYGSGNGNYIYQYDYDNTRGDVYRPGYITEGYDGANGGRYFILPKKAAYIEGSDTVYYGSSEEEKILAINSYRPNVDKSYLYINGTADSHVYIIGNAFCGGNSSTVLYDQAQGNGGNIKFKIGDHVTIAGVFLGSNGEGLADAFKITYLSNLNGIDNWAKTNSIDGQAGFGDKTKVHFNDRLAYDTSLYPNLLSLYMRAAEVTALPTEFTLPTASTDAYIGNLCLGGNYGSMMTDKTIELTLPENLVIFGSVVGGCYNSRVEFGETGKRAVALGGMTRQLSTEINPKTNNRYIDDGKVNLTIKSKFRPWRLMFDETTHVVSLVNDRTDAAGNYVSDTEATAAETKAEQDGTAAPAYSYREGLCNIFGGCFTSGKTVGDIRIDIYSDVLGYYENNCNWDAPTVNGRNQIVNRDMLKNNVTTRRTAYSVTGAGYGPLTEVEGNVHLRLLPTAGSTSHPSVLTIFSASHDGKHIGNSTTEIRDGMVFSNLYGGSRANYKYGSSEIIVGYPKYYICKESGTFTLNRADRYSYVAQAASETDSTLTLNTTQKYKARNHDGTEVIKQTVKYKAGDIVAANVVEQMIGFRPADTSNPSISTNASVTPAEANAAIISACFDEKQDLPTDFDSAWDDIDINIGDNSQINNPAAKFYGGGGVYGGGHALNDAGGSYSGINTQLAYDKDNNPENNQTSESIGYGGNSTIVIGDDPNGTKEHISIGTGHYEPVKLKKGEDCIGLYKKEEEGTGFVCMSSKILEDSDFENGQPKTTYYKMETAGGVFGDGARTFVQNFRAVDITGYGYTEHTPLTAKLINTFQRIDLLSLTDCCLQLQGTQDYATNAIDNTLYSIARIGEIRMNSSLNSSDNIKFIDDAATNLTQYKRSRNYMGFSKNVHFVGALYSNTAFDSTYRGTNGKTSTTTVDADNVETTTANDTYRNVKKGYISAYETTKDKPTFKRRNLGTSPNMVGINNGNTLKLQNVFTTEATNSATDTNLKFESKNNYYYGPIVGVVEVKLLTAQDGEGGGYIYAFNHHENKESPETGKTFLEDTGNFVFASTVETNTNALEEEGETTKTYIVDDCYPLGFYDASGNPTNHANDRDGGEEVHYWFVEGNKYFFNTTLTGYTYGKPIDFYLDNSDALILLSGITTDEASNPSIKVESITWRDHDEDYKSALRDNLNDSGTDSRSNYELLLTIDSDTENTYTITNPGNAFVARIPNGNKENGLGYLTTDEGGVTKKIFETKNNYSNKESGTNTPLLGIHLHDKDTLNNEPGFYKKYLSEDDYVVIKLKALESGTPGASDTVWNEYTINLTISYLQGPYINGTVNIENCALPGEYIYANTKDITMEMDDELTVTGMKWFLYPKQKRSAENTYFWDKSKKVDVTKYVQEGVTGNRLQLPARYYQNDWQLDFVVVVNGQEFGLNNSTMEVPRLTVHNYHRMSTVAQAVKQFGDNTTEYGYNLDLDLVGGALVYIESDKDFEIFTKYVNYCNSYRTSIADKEKVEGFQYRMAKADANPSNPAEDTGTGAVVWQKDKNAAHWARVMRAEVLPGFNRNGGVIGFKNDNTILGYDDDEDVPLQNVKNPSGAENIRFVLTKDIETTEHCMPIGQFRGRLIGNGHTINFKSGYQNSNFIDENYGEINYVGFASSGGADATGVTTAVVFDNYGQVNNCFYYNYLKPGAVGYDKFADDIPDYGRTNDAVFIGANYASLVQNIKHKVTGETGNEVYWYGSVDNCYQNSDKEQANALNVDAKKIIDEIEANNYTTAHEIRGKLSYRSSQSFHNGMIAYNLNQEYLKARWKSHDNDELVREQIQVSRVDENDNYIGGDFLYNYYADGDYRYAYVYDATNHPEALRLSLNEDGWPNYEGHMGKQSMHKSSEDVGHDDRRWFTTQRNDLVQIDFRGQIEYEEKTETVGESTVTKIVPKLGNTGYFPLYMHDADNTRAPHSDFIFFGQRITANTAEREYYPHRVNYDNRVYRASGMYGSRTDYGFHFNRDAEVVVPQTTAVDFTGTLDLKYKAGDAVDNAVSGVDYIGKPQYKERWQFYVKNGDKTEIIGADGKATQFASNKYYSYETQAGEYTPDNDGNWSYKEELAKTATDTIIQHIFYPPLLDLPGGDRPENLHNIHSFKVDSNRECYDDNSVLRDAIYDHSHVTKNLLVYTPAVGGNYTEGDEENLFGKLHYTRMHRWGDIGGETNQNNIIGHHIRWVDHSKDNGLDSHFHAVKGLFHLVDQQDFNAPIDFYVADDLKSSQETNGRAWLLRQPKHYSSRIRIPDANGFTVSKDAWESIALPFTANRVWAVNSPYVDDYGKLVGYEEKYSRGQITHFYGKDFTYTEQGVKKTNYGETHHDYWLRGLVETAKDDYQGDDVIAKADFARPGSKYDNLFQVEADINGDGNVTNLQMTGDYEYLNNWFFESYKDVAYSSNHNEYAEPMMFKNYHYLTKNAPYIVAFPGKDYYEFDLSGDFNNEKNSTNGCKPQEILYEFTVEQIDPNNNFDSNESNVRIPVTDMYEAVRRTSVAGNGAETMHMATFKRIVVSDKTGVDDDLYVLNDGTERDADDNGVLTVTVQDNPDVKLTPGSAFINCKDFGIKEILPFRTYLKVKTTDSGASQRFVMIGNGSRGIDDIGDLDEGGEEKPDYQGMNIFVKDNNLVITSDTDAEVNLYGISGQLYRHLTVKAGYNVYRGLNSGVYVTLGKKFVIKR